MNPPDDLRRILREWRDVPDAAPELAASVTRELERRARLKTRWWNGANLAGLGEHWPRLAVACVALGIVIGVAGAEWRRAREARDMPARYVRWIDPANFPRNPHGRP